MVLETATATPSPFPSNLALTSHTCIHTDGSIEDSDMSVLLEYSDAAGILKATMTIFFATENTQKDPPSTDGGKTEF
jgi:hypothetical protein